MSKKINKKLTIKKKKILQKFSKKKSFFSMKDAIKEAKKISSSNFDESVDISIRLKLDHKKGKQSFVKEIVYLPNGTGKRNYILAIVSENKKLDIEKEGGVRYIGLKYIDKIRNGWWDKNINFVISMPDVINKLNPIGKILGRKGLMPNQRLGTLSLDPVNFIRNIKSGNTIIKVDKYGIIHSSIGRISFSENNLLENLKLIIKKIILCKPSFLNSEDYIKNIYLSTTMGKSFLLDKNQFLRNE